MEVIDMGTTIALMITLVIMTPVVSLVGRVVCFFWDWNREIKGVQKYGSDWYIWNSWKYKK